jgi:hypothetical protein
MSAVLLLAAYWQHMLFVILSWKLSVHNELMKQVRIECLLALIFCWIFKTEQSNCSVSIVYNLRVAETTKHPPDEKTKGNYLETVTLFGQFRKRFDGRRQNLGGAIETFIYMPEPFYLKVDCAVARISDKSGTTKTVKTQTDDILFSAGYSISIHHQIKLTLSGLFGIPTHKELSLEEAQFGTGHVGLGVQADGSWIYCKKCSLRGAARFIHFFPRKAPFKTTSEQLFFRYNIGNLADLYIAHVCKFNKHRIGVGYDQIFLFGATIFPALDDVVEKTRHIRSSFYASYKYSFEIHKLANTFAANISYGFDLRPKSFSIKRLITAWVAWGINF